MSTVIRVKRRIDEEPLNAFVLNSKKRRFEDIDADHSNIDRQTDEAATSITVVKFAGTVQNQDDIAGHIRKLTKTEAIEASNHVRRPANITARNRSALKHNAQEDRFKIVNCFRTLNADPKDESPDCPDAAAGAADAVDVSATTAASNVTVVDIEKSDVPTEAPPSSAVAGLDELVDEQQQSATTAAAADEPQYVYDLYFPDASAPNAQMNIFIEDLLSVEPLDENLLFGSARDNGLMDTSDDSEDSNVESNWRNDYPDTEDEAGGGESDSVNEQDMRRAFDSMDLDNELSSDDENAANERRQAANRSGFVYTIDGTENAAGDDSIGDSDVDEDDVDRYGMAYARYKARLLRKSQKPRQTDSDADSYANDSEDYADEDDSGSD